MNLSFNFYFFAKEILPFVLCDVINSIESLIWETIVTDIETIEKWG